MENKDKTSEKFAKFMNKASDFGKKAAGEIQKGAKEIGQKAADGVQKGAKELSEQTQKTLYEQRLKHYNPLFREEFFSEEFHLPNVIKIVDDAERRDIDVCKGAIGWRETVKGVEILFLYDEFVKESKIKFLPFVKCDKIYCLDAFEKGKYVSSDTIFDSASREKMAELENIAYCLGAKKYYIEVVESNLVSKTNALQVNIDSNIFKGNTEQGNASQSINYASGKNYTILTGNNTLQKPKLKWFRYDDNIKNLIQMRLSGDNTIKCKSLILHGSASETISQNIAIAIDALSKVRGNATMTSKSQKEHNTLMILDIEF